MTSITITGRILDDGLQAHPDAPDMDVRFTILSSDRVQGKLYDYEWRVEIPADKIKAEARHVIRPYAEVCIVGRLGQRIHGDTTEAVIIAEKLDVLASAPVYVPPADKADARAGVF